MVEHTSPIRPVVRTALITVLIAAGWLTLCQLAALALVATIDGSATLSVADRTKAINDARTSIIQLCVALGLIGGLAYTAGTYALTRRLHAAERFQAATEQVSSKSTSVRVAGIHNLAALASINSEYWETVDQVLTALVRERSTDRQQVWVDVLAALSVVGGDARRRPQRLPGKGLRLHLDKAYLSGLDLTGLVLDRVSLDGAYVERTDFTDSSLVGASLVGIHANEAIFSATRLDNADFTGGELAGARLPDAVLDGADFTGCDMSLSLELRPQQVASAAVAPSHLPVLET